MTTLMILLLAAAEEAGELQKYFQSRLYAELFEILVQTVFPLYFINMKWRS